MRMKVLVVALLLTGCVEYRASSTPAAHTAVRPATPDGAKHVPESPAPAINPSGAAMPGDACTADGYWSFFESFVRYPALRPAHSDAAGQAALALFDIAQQDSRWVRATAPAVALDINETRDGNRFAVKAVPVELDPEDEIVRTLGDPRRYRFELSDGCWRFSGIE